VSIPRSSQTWQRLQRELGWFDSRTGLGLSIVRNIVQQHRGEIEVQSTIGEGTDFRVILPCNPLGL